MSNEEMIKVLRDARALIEKPENWRQGSDPEGITISHCVVTAVAEVSHPDELRYPAWSILQKLAPEAFKNHPLSYYNDASSTTHDDVLNLFDKALAELGGLGE